MATTAAVQEKVKEKSEKDEDNEGDEDEEETNEIDIFKYNSYCHA